MNQAIIFISALLLLSCEGKKPTSGDAAAIGEIQEVMNQQQEAWNHGDLEGFMQGYWRSDSLRFIGKRGITYGWQATLDNYKKGYPDVTAMGKLQFTNLSMEITGDSTAYVIGKWELFRDQDTLGGHYSLLWRSKEGRWLIVADHTS